MSMVSENCALIYNFNYPCVHLSGVFSEIVLFLSDRSTPLTLESTSLSSVNSTKLLVSVILLFFWIKTTLRMVNSTGLLYTWVNSNTFVCSKILPFSTRKFSKRPSCLFSLDRIKTNLSVGMPILDLVVTRFWINTRACEHEMHGDFGKFLQ